MVKSPEFASVLAFVQWCCDDERSEFSHEDLTQLNWQTGARMGDLRKELEGYGLKLAARAFEKRVRGFTTSSNDRWFGPGSLKTHGGAAYDGMMVAKYGSKDTIGG